MSGARSCTARDRWLAKGSGRADGLTGHTLHAPMTAAVDELPVCHGCTGSIPCERSEHQRWNRGHWHSLPLPLPLPLASAAAAARLCRWCAHRRCSLSRVSSSSLLPSSLSPLSAARTRVDSTGPTAAALRSWLSGRARAHCTALHRTAIIVRPDTPPGNSSGCSSVCPRVRPSDRVRMSRTRTRTDTGTHTDGRLARSGNGREGQQDGHQQRQFATDE